MIVHASRRFAWIVTSTGLFLTFAILILGYRTNFYGYNGEITIWYAPLINLVFPIASLFVGGLITTRLPRNIYGWLWILMGLGIGVIQSIGALIVNWALSVTPPLAILGGLAIYFSGLGWLLSIVMLILTLLLFPTGRILSHKWRWITWMIFFIAIVEMLISWAIPGQSGLAPFVNPIGQHNMFGMVANAVTFGGIGLLLLAAFPLSVASLIIRYRQGTWSQRAQIRWLAFAGLFNILVLIIDGTNVHLPWISEEVMTNISTLLISAIPIAVAVAILRYRLYDIDLIIRRTLQYGLLSLILGGLYYGLVVVFGQIIQSVTGQTSPAVIVISTLVIAALFNPLRRRIQQVIDRRFFRQRYDADRTLETFSSVARQETDLERLSANLIGTVEQSIQPESVALWIRSTPAGMNRSEK